MIKALKESTATPEGKGKVQLYIYMMVGFRSSGVKQGRMRSSYAITVTFDGGLGGGFNRHEG